MGDRRLTDTLWTALQTVAAAEIASEVAQIIADRKIAERLECIDICPMLGSAEIEFYRRDKEWWPFPHVDEPGRSDMSDEMVGTYMSRYVDEMAWRFNRREMDVTNRMNGLFACVEGRLRYRELIA